MKLSKGERLGNELLVEIFLFLLISLRIYVLSRFSIQSGIDKIFALYYLKNHNPLLGYFIIFYMFVTIFIEFIFLQIIDITLVILAVVEAILLYKTVFLSFHTESKKQFLDMLLKNRFSSLTREEHRKTVEEYTKPVSVWKLYLLEFIVFFISISTIESQRYY